ncbi:MAG: lyase [Cytophagia bacterium]|nr:lyase [Cytophagia bacterium]NBW33912.1 lyase [Cytophagia bacterium]
MKIVNRKSMLIRESGRSTDFISPSFGHGCLFNCTYCYMKRHKPKGLDIAKNTGEILTAINNHSCFTVVDKPNQTHESLITYDISCNEDFALHLKYHNWQQIFKYFKTSDKAMGSFATKYVNRDLLTYNPEKRIRIRFSLMPQVYADQLEPNTSVISERMAAINDFIEAGYDVHVNFSPVIVTDGWLEQYRELFKQLDKAVKDEHKPHVKAEVIFLTHNTLKHHQNLEDKLPGEDLLWRPDIQEDKISQYGGVNLRYKASLKSKYIQEFVDLHDEIIKWNTIRYIF